MNSATRPTPPDQPQRERALDPRHSILVQAPAGSGKTDLLTRRFLRLLAEVERPGEVVAITFTNAAAAEMRHRILGELEKAASSDAQATRGEEFSMPALARRALDRSLALDWKLLELPAQLRISTIDSFCRELALQQPLLSGLGGSLEIAELPEELYRRAVRATLQKIDLAGQPLAEAIEALLLWRDNGWQEMEDLLVEMLQNRDRWMHEFLLDRQPDWEALRARLERPFGQAVRTALARLDALFAQMPPAREEALALARFACERSGLYREFAERAEVPFGPYADGEALDEARLAYLHLAPMLLTNEGLFRKQITVRQGFPPERKREKTRLAELIAGLRSIPGLEAALASIDRLPPARYTEPDWQIVRACFTLLRHAAGELQVVFAQAGTVDFIEVSQIAQRVLRGADGLPTDAALAVADGIRHLLVDEFQDTSRRQHQLLASVIAAWPERPGRTCFAVGDPMQSIYFFRDADAELFPRVKNLGLEIPQDTPLLFDFVPLQANFRTAPRLVERLNELFEAVFAKNDGSGVSFSAAQPAREADPSPGPPFRLHLEFAPQARLGAADPVAIRAREDARAAQLEEIVALIRSHSGRIAEARATGGRYRVAVLGRARSALAPIAQALRAAQIPFRAIDLEPLQNRPEVLDALALARALLNPLDRVAWLGVLRAPWCGLSLDDLHRLVGADDRNLVSRPIPQLLSERLTLLSEPGRLASERVLQALDLIGQVRSAQPAGSLGTWLQRAWQSLGGDRCVDPAARANLDLLWSCLDRLPGGEEDLLGPALNSALGKLTALPDPAVTGERGVQLMTIHKSKGLEFEVVIVPELQAGGGRGSGKMLAWLERGVAANGDGGEIAEFLVAPLQPKGTDRGKAKAWVDRVYAERESQETRRILYVAATRAREELHLFARPAYKTDAFGALTLAEPSNSLLATAWPALESEVRARFEEWREAKLAETSPAESIAESIAASGESNLLAMPSPFKPTVLRRLPPEHRPPSTPVTALKASQAPGGPSLGFERLEYPLYARHEGGLLSRALGTAVHTLLEELARLRTQLDEDSARSALLHLEPSIAAQVRSAGVDPGQAAGIAAEALGLALAASRDPAGAWILAPHPEAANEARWTGLLAGGLHAVQADRVFRAGTAPFADGSDVWWIVDYKTAHAESANTADAIAELRSIFAPQLESYAGVLRALQGAGSQIRAGLFYPRMTHFDWWEIECPESKVARPNVLSS